MRNGREHLNYNTSAPLALCMMLVIYTATRSVAGPSVGRSHVIMIII